MSQSYPPDPPNRRSNPSFDELIAIVIALATMGGILFWVWGQNNKKLVQVPNQRPAEVSPSPGIVGMMEQYLPDGVSPMAGTPSPAATVQPQQPITQPGVIGVAPETTPSTVGGVLVAPQTPPADPTAVAPATTGEPQPTMCSTRPNASGCPATPVAPAVVPVPIPTTPTTPAATAPSPTPQTPTTPPQPAPPTANKLDVPQGYWATPFLAYFVEKNWVDVTQKPTFKPDETLTRAEFADQLQQAFKTPKEQQAIGFKDVPQSFWAKPAIQDASQSGFLQGYPGEIFRPKQQIPRVQVLVALSSGLGLKTPDKPEEVLKVYQDADQIPKWAVGAVAAATEAGLVVNYPNQNTLNPNQPATYSEAAAMIYQGLVYRDQAKPITSEYIVNPK